MNSIFNYGGEIMINNNYFYTDEINNPRQMPGISYIRLFHAAPGAPEVDIYANGRQVAKRLAYGQFTDYISLAAGTYTIEAFPVGLQVSPIFRINLPIEQSKVYTLAVIGILPKIGILPVEDVYEAISPGTLNIRFANLSPNAPSLDLAVRGGQSLFTDISYTEVSDYRQMRPGNYNLVVRPTRSPIIVTALPNTRLLPRRNLTFYLLGLYGQQPSSLEVYIPLDGTTYLRDY
jgi:hypothetical protein